MMASLTRGPQLNKQNMSLTTGIRYFTELLMSTFTKQAANDLPKPTHSQVVYDSPRLKTSKANEINIHVHAYKL